MPRQVKRIGIGIGTDADKIFGSIRKIGSDIEVHCYCLKKTASDLHPIEGTVIEAGDEPCEAMVSDLAAGRIDAAVRGTLPSNDTLKALKRAMGVDHLERIALLETPDGTRFLLTPVGIDEGWTARDKLGLIEKGRVIARKFGLSEKVGVVSGGRLGDIGRHPRVDESMAEAELVARLGNATHCEILIENAVRDCGLIIAPDGISGNLIFRTLVLLGNGYGHGAPVVNIGKIFVDTSRASPDYAKALMLAASMLD